MVLAHPVSFPAFHYACGLIPGLETRSRLKNTGLIMPW